MELQIFNNPEFGDVRVIMKNGEPWFVGKDVATALGYSNPQKAVRDHVPDKFKGVNEMDTPGGKQNVVVVNEAGMYKLVMRSKLESAEKFSDWVCEEVIPSIRKTGSYSIAQSQSVLLKAASEIDPLSEILQNTFAVKRGIALSQAIDLVGNNYKLNFDSLKQLLPPAEHETGYLNPTQLAPKIGVRSPKFVNKKLERLGLQYRDGKDWRLTDAGKAYGEEMPYTRNGHSGYQIRWNESLIDFVNAV